MRPLHRRIPLLPLALAASLAGGAASAAPRVPPALAERAAAQGAVRVLVRLDVAATPEGWLARRADREEQRRRIAQAQADLASSLTEHARLDLQSSSCGLGAELALLLPLLEGLRRRRCRPHP
jgi:hypothetical protein